MQLPAGAAVAPPAAIARNRAAAASAAAALRGVPCGKRAGLARQGELVGGKLALQGQTAQIDKRVGISAPPGIAASSAAH